MAELIYFMNIFPKLPILSNREKKLYLFIFFVPLEHFLTENKKMHKMKKKVVSCKILWLRYYLFFFIFSHERIKNVKKNPTKIACMFSRPVCGHGAGSFPNTLNQLGDQSWHIDFLLNQRTMKILLFSFASELAAE